LIFASFTVSAIVFSLLPTEIMESGKIYEDAESQKLYEDMMSQWDPLGGTEYERLNYERGVKTQIERMKKMREEEEKAAEEEKIRIKEEREKKFPKVEGEIDPPENLPEIEPRIRFLSTVAPPMNWQEKLTTVIGAQHTGKTQWLYHLFDSVWSQFRYGFVFSGSPDSSEDYDWIDPQHVFDSWEDEVERTEHEGPRIVKGFRSALQNAMGSQKEMVIRYGKENTPHIFIIIDDPMGKINFHKEPIFQEIAGMLRKFNIAMWIFSQYLNYLAPWLRNNPLRTVFFANSEDDLYKAKGMTVGFRSRREWAEFITVMTADYGGVLYDREKREFWCFRAPAHRPEFRLEYDAKSGQFLRERKHKRKREHQD
jgi:hypothetical protein